MSLSVLTTSQCKEASPANVKSMDRDTDVYMVFDSMIIMQSSINGFFPGPDFLSHGS